ncbi:hypothetical protein E2L06_20880 [Haloterrigena sp. H1]|uniref:hypothetical protein n=1 Tax=Haloterrigena sp. H1 TaxID=2552943 RepID=UPI00110DD657|nr:hypothetical protein [Haloterrigena sp. H1]TMT78012.1 hypothetical protein E2L06_20880 [Haloterrigena sp. H1]
MSESPYDWYTVAFDLLSIVTLLAWLGAMEILFAVSETFQVIIAMDGGIWIPAVLTVSGSFLLYRKRKIDDKKRLELAFIAEIKELSNLAKLPSRLRDLEKPPTKDRIPPDAVPSAESLPTIVYENNVGNISRLDDELAEEIVGFYSLLMRHKATISMIQEEDPRDAGTHTLPMSDHKDFFDDVGDLRRKRRKLLNELEKRQ